MKVVTLLFAVVTSVGLLTLGGCQMPHRQSQGIITRVERTALVLSDSRGRPTDAAKLVDREQLTAFLREHGYLPEQYRLVDDAAAADRVIFVTVDGDGAYRVRSVMVNTAFRPETTYARSSYAGSVYTGYTSGYPVYYDPYYRDSYNPYYYDPAVVVPPVVIDRPHDHDHRPDDDRPDDDRHNDRRRGPDRDRDGDGKPDRPVHDRPNNDRPDTDHRPWHPRHGGNDDAPQPPRSEPPSYRPPEPVRTPDSATDTSTARANDTATGNAFDSGSARPAPDPVTQRRNDR